MICIFCNNPVTPGTGFMLVRTTGETLAFCSSKCRRNMLGRAMKKPIREGRHMGWTSKTVALVGEKKAEKKESAFAKDIAAKLAEKAARKPEAKK